MTNTVDFSRYLCFGHSIEKLTSEAEDETGETTWRSWYDFFPWEDWRSGKPEILSETIEPMLPEWAARPGSENGSSRTESRMDRLGRQHAPHRRRGVRVLNNSQSGFAYHG